jgi:hypothetical protein
LVDDLAGNFTIPSLAVCPETPQPTDDAGSSQNPRKPGLPVRIVLLARSLSCSSAEER